MVQAYHRLFSYKTHVRKRQRWIVYIIARARDIEAEIVVRCNERQSAAIIIILDFVSTRSITAGGHVRSFYVDSYPRIGTSMITARGGGSTHPVSTHVVHHARERRVTTLWHRYVLHRMLEIRYQAPHCNISITSYYFTCIFIRQL